MRKLLSAMKAHVKHLEREWTAETKIMQHLLDERRETRQTVCCQLADGEVNLQGLYSKMAVATAEMSECQKLVAETVEVLKAHKVDVALHWAL